MDPKASIASLSTITYQTFSSQLCMAAKGHAWQLILDLHSVTHTQSERRAKTLIDAKKANLPKFVSKQQQTCSDSDLMMETKES